VTTPRITIRDAKIGDYPRCLPLLDSLYHGDIGRDFKKTFVSFIRHDQGVVLLAQSRGEVFGILIGSCQMDIDWEGVTARIDAIVVSQKRRRTGIGGRLAKSFIKLAQKQGCKAVKSRVGRKNDDAQRFHKSMGFSRVDTYEYALDLS
jgi:GNAT superfamily N-acetyltransferase